MKVLVATDAYLEAYDLYYGTPLHVACANEHTDCVKVLLNAGESHHTTQDEGMYRTRFCTTLN